MGNSVSCLCPYNHSTRKEVLVMKEDGELITFTKGTQVKDILAAYPYHKIIKCSSIDQSVLPASFRLCCNRLYFLLPEGLAVCNVTFDSLLRAARSNEKELRLPKAITHEEISSQKMEPLESGGGEDGKVVAEKIFQMLDDDTDYRYKKPTWKPSLQTIKEVGTPLHAA